MDVNVNDMFYHYGGGQPVRLTLLSAAVEIGALESVTYLMEIGADPYQKVDNWGTDWVHGMALWEDEWDGNDWLETPEYEFAKEMWTEFVSKKYNMSRKVCRDLIDVEGQNWIELHPAQDGEPYVHVVSRSLGIGDNYDIGRIRIWTAEDSAHTATILQESTFNSNQRAIILYGRDSLIARVVRGESSAIAEEYKKGFEAFCFYAERKRVKQNRHCSFLLAKKDGRLLYILKGLANFNIPVELREHIVGLLFFGKGPKIGRGQRVYPSGTVHVGEFKDGEPHGEGKQTYAEGSIFVGKFLNGLAYGPGTFWNSSGKADICVYKDGEADGKGILWDVDRSYVWELQDGMYTYSHISLEEAAQFAANVGLPVPPPVPPPVE